MESDETLAKRRDDPLARLIVEDLDPFSVDELRARLDLLAGEITRVKQKIEGAVNHRATADSLFKG